MPRQTKPPRTAKQIEAFERLQARNRELRESGVLKRVGGHWIRTDRPAPPESGPRAVVVPDPPREPAPAPAETKVRRISWPTPPPSKSAAPVVGEPETAAPPPDDGLAPSSAHPAESPASSPPPTPAPRKGFLAGLLEGFSE